MNNKYKLGSNKPILTSEEAWAACEKYGSTDKAAKALGVGRSTIARAKRRGCKPSATKADKDEGALRGHEIGSNVRVMRNQPQKSTRLLLNTLERGKYYSVRDASQAWGVGVDTIRKHAIDADVLRYIEIDDQWQPCIMHPDTAKKHSEQES